MKCPKCGAQTRIVTVNENKDGSVKRERDCPKCKAAFTTTERRLAPKKGPTQSAIDKFITTALKRQGGK